MKHLRHLLTLLLLLVALAPGIALVANVLSLSSLKALTESHLAGVTTPSALPQWSVTDFMSGKFQNSAVLWLDEHMGHPREMMIRLNNGLGYRVGRSFNPHVVIGENSTLYDANYIRSWCATEVSPSFESRIQVQAQTIAQIRDLVEASGRIFMLVISPGKPAIYPENIAEYCQPNPLARGIVRLEKVLQDNNVAFFDGDQILLKAKSSQTFPLFGRDGLHWNRLGASILVQKMTDLLETKLQKPVRHLSVMGIATDNKPEAGDEDLGDLLNLSFKLRPYPSPHPAFSVNMEGYAPRILMVGTSFCWQLLGLLGEAKLSDDVKFYYYFSQRVEVVNGQRGPLSDHFAAGETLPADFKNSEVVLLDLNEANILSIHVKKFANALSKLKL